MNKALQAAKLHDAGFSCSQSVIAVFCEDFGLDREFALKIATGFGGGIAGKGEYCGVITGALMVLGLKFGRCCLAELQAKDNTYKAADILFRSFTEKHLSLFCRDLKLEEGSSREAKDLIRKKCNEYISDTVIILDELISN